MAKNNAFINNQKRLQQQVECMVPAVYASIAMVLDEGKMEYEDISYIFARSQEIWEEHGSDLISLLIKCYNQTGIQLMTDKQYANAIKKGLVKEGD